VHLIEHESDVDSLDFAPDTKLVLLSQTTLSVDETADTIAALKAKFPWIQEPPSSDICYATSNRQAAVKLVAQQSDCVVIVGSANSSNSVRLMEVAQEGLGERGKAYRVDDASELDPAWFEGLESVGISSGASVPDELVSGVIDALQNLGFTGMKSVETIKETCTLCCRRSCAGRSSHSWLPSVRGAKNGHHVPIGAATAFKTLSRSCGFTPTDRPRLPPETRIWSNCRALSSNTVL